MAKKITIIGAGPGGYTAAFEAAKKGADVTLIERNFLGGTCLNYGCIPTKNLKASAEAFELVHNAKNFGIITGAEATIDMQAVIARKEKVSVTLRGGLEKTCAQLKVKTVFGNAKIINANLVEVKTNEGITKIESDDIIIATGSSTLNLPNLPIDHKFILDSDDALELKYVPKSIIIVGGGVIGCELAFIYQAFGSKVTLVEGLDRVLPMPSLDEEMSKIIQREMKKSGISTELASVVDTCEIKNNKVIANVIPSPFLEHTKVKESKTIEADVIIVAVGRVPNTQNLGIEELGIECDKRGFIITNEYLESNILHIYAIGDILGPSKIMLAHMAVAEAFIAIDNIFGAKKTCNYTICPSAIFTSPEIGSVGITEKQAKEQGLDIKVEVFQCRELGKAQAMGSLAGAFKLIADAKTNKLIGAHIAGAHASDLIAELALAMQLNASIEDIAHTIHAHPTLAEGVFEAAHRMI